jgi:hypothetical protein
VWNWIKTLVKKTWSKLIGSTDFLKEVEKAAFAAVESTINYDLNGDGIIVAKAELDEFAAKFGLKWTRKFANLSLEDFDEGEIRNWLARARTIVGIVEKYGPDKADIPARIINLAIEAALSFLTADELNESLKAKGIV